MFLEIEHELIKRNLEENRMKSYVILALGQERTGERWGKKTVWNLKKRGLLMVIHGFWCTADLVQLDPVLPT